MMNKTTKSRAAYQASRRAHSVTLYFRSVEELEDYKQQAQAGGYGNFNAWLLQMLANATSGAVFPPEYVEGLRKDLERARAWLETSRDEAADYRAQLRTLQQQRDALAVLAHRAAEPEAVARILAQQGASA